MAPDTLRKMRKTNLVLLLALVLACCTTPQDMWDQARTANRSKLIQLHVGMDREAVLHLMGTEPMLIRDLRSVVTTINNPYRTEMYRAGDHRFEILFYYTDLKSSDGAISDDELTPLVMLDGSLDGWGWSYLKDVSAKYEIRLR
jgi:hypothetical protein